MRMRTTWLSITAALLSSMTVVTALAADQEPDLTKKMRESHRRNLPSYIKQLHQPAAQNSTFRYEQLMQWIASSRDPRAIPTMIEMLSDTGARQTRDALLIAADFLGSMGARSAIPVLKQNLTLERRFAARATGAGNTLVMNRAVQLGAAAALFQLGDLHAALPVFRSVLALGDSDPGAIPSNAFRAVGTSIDAYRDRPEDLDTIYRYFRKATQSRNPELRAGAALRLVGTDTELAFEVAQEVLGLRQPKSEDDVLRWYYVSDARRKAVSVLRAIGDDRSRLLLKGLAQDSEESVRVAAGCALREIEQRK